MLLLDAFLFMAVGCFSIYSFELTNRSLLIGVMIRRLIFILIDVDVTNICNRLYDVDVYTLLYRVTV